MKTNIILKTILGVFLAGHAFAQNNNLVIFSEQGEKFTVILNGIRQNGKPETNVKITDLDAPNYKVKVIFEQKIPDLNQNVYMMNEGSQASNTEITYSIINKKGKYKLRGVSVAPIENKGVTEGQSVVVYSPTGPATTEQSVSTNVSTTGGTTDQVNVSTTAGGSSTTTTTTTTTGTPTGENISMNINVGGTGLNINVNGTGTSTGASTSTTYSETTTTTTTTTSGTTGTTAASGTSTTAATSGYVLPGYNGEYGCPVPMGENDFESAKESIKSKSFEDSRITVAKQIISSNCLLSSQVKEIMMVMDFEASKLDIAKYAYKYTLDRGNYYKLNDAFDFESSISELDSYVKSQK